MKVFARIDIGIRVRDTGDTTRPLLVLRLYLAIDGPGSTEDEAADGRTLAALEYRGNRVCD
jgi:hypothetical protein